jgi:lysylphosphatidylglycerol synthetase-like protein (DUF2156 family)
MRSLRPGNFFPAIWFQLRVFLNFLKSLVAVVSGNAIYFFLLVPVLPHGARHRPFHFDLGLVLDAWICLVIYGVLSLVHRSKGREVRRSSE